MKKQIGRDYPLSTTPSFKATSDSTPVQKPFMTGKQFRQQKTQLKREQKLEAVKAGTLGTDRINKAKAIVGVVKDAVSTAAAAKTLLTSGGTGGRTSGTGGRTEYRR
jgi:hypothetical protein